MGLLETTSACIRCCLTHEKWDLVLVFSLVKLNSFMFIGYLDSLVSVWLLLFGELYIGSVC